jgi:RimJ/RimL family protein N-acetyltransferase
MESGLETERLTLRAFTEADVDDLVALESDPAVMRYITGGSPTPRAVIEREILPRFIRAGARHDGYGVWAVIEKATGEFLGWFSFQPYEGGAPVDIALGYRLRRSAWGKGYATEGARALIHRGFAACGAQRVFATTYQDNLASRRVMEKAGLRLARVFRMTPEALAAHSVSYVPPAELWDGDDVEYAVTRSEWERQEAEREKRRSDDAGVH